MQVTVVQLLDGRGLEALAPAQPETEVADGEHGAHLGRQPEAETAVVDQAKACGKVQPAEQVELVLHIEGGSPVVCRSRFRALRGFQIVVPVFCPCIQGVFARQMEDALQLAHHPLLVTLQLALPRQHGHREPISVLIAKFLALKQYIIVVLGRVVVVIGMTVPVNIQRQVIRLFTFHFSLFTFHSSLFTSQLPLTAYGCRSIIVT